MYGITYGVPEASLANLHKHKYSHVGATTLDTLMDPFWHWVTGLFPKAFPPNIMTLGGWLVSVLGAIAAGWAYPTFTERPIVWVNCLVALSIFVHQTLDACDGKQARRQGSSTPYGQLLDHSCDAFTTGLSTFGFVASTCQGYTGLSIAVMLVLHMELLLFVWREKATSEHKSATANFGTTEAQQIAMLLVCCAPLVPYGLLRAQLAPFLPGALRALAGSLTVGSLFGLGAVLLGSVLFVGESAAVVWGAADWPRVAGSWLVHMSHAVAHGLFLASPFAWAHPRLAILLTVVSNAQKSIKVLTSNACQTKLAALDPASLPYYAFAAFAGLPESGHPGLSLCLCAAVFAWTLVDSLAYWLVASLQMSKALGVNLLGQRLKSRTA